MAKAKITSDRYPLTIEQAAAMVDGWAVPFFNTDSKIADLLLLLRALV